MARGDIPLFMEECFECHILFWIPTQHHDSLYKNKKSFFCPNGHSQHYTGKSDAERVRELTEENKNLQTNWDESAIEAQENYEKWQEAEKELEACKAKKIKKKKKKDDNKKS